MRGRQYNSALLIDVGSLLPMMIITINGFLQSTIYRYTNALASVRL